MPTPFFNQRLPESPQPATVDTASPAFMQQYIDLKPCSDLMGGTEAMRRAGKAYIPMESGEQAEQHKQRIGRTVLRNIFKQTIQYNRGQVFTREVALDNADSVLSEEQMAFFDTWKENVDQRGCNLTSWAGTVFQQGLVDGVTFCLVDFPSIESQEVNGQALYRAANGEWHQRTRNTDRQEGWLPYLVHIHADQVLDCRAEWQNGKRIITHFRYVETTVEDDADNPWGQDVVQFIRAYWRDHWELWRKGEGDTEFYQVAEGQLSLSEIPLVVFMPGDKRTEFTAQPALMDLAWLNIRHWQATCEQFDLMSFVRRPPWYIIGLDSSQTMDSAGNPRDIHFGPGHVLYLPTDASMNNVGVDPGSVEAGRSELRDLEEAMATYGLQILQRPSMANVTATQVQRESRENNSTLKNWALDFQDFLENCLHFVALWQEFPDGPSAKVNDDFADNANNDFLMRLYDKGLISQELLATLMKRSGALPDDYDYAEEQVKLARETTNMANAGVTFNQSLTERARTLLNQFTQGRQNAAPANNTPATGRQ